MKRSVLVSLLGLIIGGSAFAADKVIVTTATDAGCFQLPNIGVQAAIASAVEKAEEKCQYPILRDLKVSIRQVGGCNPSTVKATFSCMGDQTKEEPR